MPKSKPNLQERIFMLIKEVGLSNGQKTDICKARYSKGQVCLLTREQGLDLEEALTSVVDLPPKEAYQQLIDPTKAVLAESLKASVPTK